MNMSPFRAAFGVMFTLAALSLASPSSAQQKTSPWPQQPPALSQSQPPALSAQAAPPAQAPAPAVDAQPAPTPATSDTTAAPDGSRSLKSTTVALRDQRRKVAGGSAVRARRQGQRAVVVAVGGNARGAAFGGNFQRYRHQGAGGLELCRDRAG